MNEVIITPELEAIPDSAVEVYEQTKDIAISNILQYEHEIDRLKYVKGRIKEVEGKRDKIAKPIRAGLTAFMGFFKNPLDLLGNAESNIKRAILGYDEKLEEVRRKEQKKLDDLAEKERRRLQKLAERQEIKGNVEKADETRERAESVPVAVVTTPKPQIKGISKRDNWIFIITNPTLIPREYMIPDEKKLGNVARATKGTLKIPGVVIKNSPVIASRIS